MRKLLVLMFGITLLIGCEGSSGGGGGSSNPSTDATVNGVVANSNVTGQVCYDRNNNKVCESGEPSSTINSDGSFALTGTHADSLASPIIAELSNSSTQSLLSVTNHVSVLETLPGKRLISPVTTLVKAKVDSNPLLSVDAAQAEVKSDLGVSSSVDLFDPNDVHHTSAINAQVYSVISLMVEALNQLGIQFSSGLMSLIYAEINDQLAAIMSSSADDIVDNSVGGKTKEQIENGIDDLKNNTPNTYNAAEMAQQGFSVYMFNDHPTTGLNFCLWKFSATNVDIYCNGGKRDNSGKLVLPTESNNSNVESFSFTISGGLIDFYASSSDQHVIFRNFTKIDADGMTLKAYPSHDEQPVTFFSGAVIYKTINGYAESCAFSDPANGEVYLFNYDAANNIRMQWDENYIP